MSENQKLNAGERIVATGVGAATFVVEVWLLLAMRREVRRSGIASRAIRNAKADRLISEALYESYEKMIRGLGGFIGKAIYQEGEGAPTQKTSFRFRSSARSPSKLRLTDAEIVEAIDDVIDVMIFDPDACRMLVESGKVPWDKVRFIMWRAKGIDLGNEPAWDNWPKHGAPVEIFEDIFDRFKDFQKTFDIMFGKGRR